MRGTICGYTGNIIQPVDEADNIQPQKNPPNFLVISLQHLHLCRTNVRYMPVKKIDKQELLHRCWEVFNRHGYHGTSVSMLAEATGLGKSGLMHHHLSKESLMLAVMEYAQETLRTMVFSVVREDLPPEQKLEKLLRRQNRLVKIERQGCFFANTALETGREGNFNEPIQQIWEEWKKAVASILKAIMSPEEAANTAYRLLLEYEGAIIMYKISNETQHLEQFVARAVALFGKKMQKKS
ncbi:MAG: TetR/AcrR family transcriptional regulator [Saprospiraceae bacterium]|nr:TetR/AcrR family transcriptional regulator [Saprospiraceae bacterium]